MSRSTHAAGAFASAMTPSTSTPTAKLLRDDVDVLVVARILPQLRHALAEIADVQLLRLPDARPEQHQRAGDHDERRSAGSRPPEMRAHSQLPLLSLPLIFFASRAERLS